VSEAATDQETRAQADEKPLEAKFWLGELTAAAKRDEAWHTAADKVLSRYKDERGLDSVATQRVNILWSNTELLKAALFSGIGKPDVRRRFANRGQEDKAARTTAMLLERALSYCNDSYDADLAVEAAIEDELLPGRGVCWTVYEADVEDDQPAPEDEPTAIMGETITDQRVRWDYVFFKDFRCSYGRVWADVWWVARRHHYTRDDLKRYFPQHADKVPLNARIEGAPDTDKDADDDTFKRACVWEIWDKTKRQRCYVAEGYQYLLQPPDDDPYKLERFFPCQEPLYAIKTTSSLTPSPEFLQYKDQANELDEIASRLYNLVEACKRRGVYAADIDGQDSQLQNLMLAGDNEFIPVRNFAALMDKGGLSAVFQTEDLQPIVAAINVLYEKAAVTIQRIYEVTGISDVIRGATNPNETATAQRIKGQFGSMRLSKRQDRLQRFLRDGYRIKAELIAEHFTREKLAAMTGMQLPTMAEIEQAKQQLQMLTQPPQMGHNGGPPMPGGMQAGPGMQPQQPTPQKPTPQKPPDIEQIKALKAIASSPPWEEIEAILRSDQRRGYVIDVETDVTAEVDAAEERKQRIEFVQAIMQMMDVAMPAALQQPKLVPFSRELTAFAMRAFKVGRSLEETLEDVFDQMEDAAMAAAAQEPQQQTDPEAEAKAEKIKAETEAIKAKAQAAMQGAQANTQAKVIDMGLKQRDAQAKQQLHELDAAGKVAQMQRDQQADEVDLQLRLAEAFRPEPPQGGSSA
jgi:hypothetical protein